MRQWRLAAGVSPLLLLCALVGGCTPEPISPPPPPSPTVSPTPSENAIDRQRRLDFEAAEKSYRTFRAEYGRVMRAGGASKPTPVMTATATGEYLDAFVELTEAYKGLNLRETGKEKIVYVRPNAHSSTSLLFDVCEDSRGVKTIDDDGRVTGEGEIRTAKLEVNKTSGRWKVSSGVGVKVATCNE